MQYIKIIIILWYNTEFTITPSEQVVGVGQDAVFRCYHPNIPFISWKLNKTIRIVEGNPGPSGITAGRTLDGSGTVIDFTLTIMAQTIYNGTEIVCIATFPGGNVPNEETISVSLTIQGKKTFLATPVTLKITQLNIPLYIYIYIYIILYRSVECGD